MGWYCRSNYVLISQGLMRELGTITTLRRREIVKIRDNSSSRAEPLSGLEDIPPAYAEFLIGWLTGTAEPHWYRARPLQAGEQDWFWAKLQSILNEHLLSARLQSNGALLVSPLHAGVVGAIASLRRQPANALDFYSDRGARLRLALRVLLG